MPRSPVLSGRVDARDRAHQRHRRDRKARASSDPHDLLSAWLEGSSLVGLDAEKLERLDLDEYARDTGSIDLPTSERLRHLAIHLEQDFQDSPEALDRIYAEAARLNPLEPTIWHSRGITAKWCAEVATKTKVVERCKKRSLDYLLKADELLPNDADTLYSLGLWHFDHGTKDEALVHFERVIALQPTHAFAHLYRASALHEQERWAQAVVAYSSVPLETLTRVKAFIVDVVLEDVAYCKLRAHDRAGALEDFTRLLDRLEKEPHRAEALSLHLLHDACQGPFREELRDRYNAIAVKAGLQTQVEVDSMKTRYDRMANGTLATWVHPTPDADVVARIADALKAAGAIMQNRVEGLDELHWDYELEGKMFTLHSQHYLGIALMAHDKTPASEELLRRTAERVLPKS